jgi:hypothetical protein
VVQLHHAIEQIHAAGAEVYVIGHGAPMFIAGLRETTGFTGPVYTDPTLAVQRAAQLRHGLGSMLSLAAGARTIRAAARGFKQGSVQGDATQQGGALVIAPGGEVRYHHISKSPGDNADVADLLRALRA